MLSSKATSETAPNMPVMENRHGNANSKVDPLSWLAAPLLCVLCDDGLRRDSRVCVDSQDPDFKFWCFEIMDLLAVGLLCCAESISGLFWVQMLT